MSAVRQLEPPIQPADAAAMLGVSVRTVYALAAPNGPIPCYRVGRRVVFNAADVLEYISQCQLTEIRKRLLYVLVDRYVDGQRIRSRKLLPKTWNQAKAHAYDVKETARLYAVATCLERPKYLINDAVAVYLRERAPLLKTGNGVEMELAQMYWAYKGKSLTDLADVCRTYVAVPTCADSL